MLRSPAPAPGCPPFHQCPKLWSTPTPGFAVRFSKTEGDLALSARSPWQPLTGALGSLSREGGKWEHGASTPPTPASPCSSLPPPSPWKVKLLPFCSRDHPGEEGLMEAWAMTGQWVGALARMSPQSGEPHPSPAPPMTNADEAPAVGRGPLFCSLSQLSYHMVSASWFKSGT